MIDVDARQSALKAEREALQSARVLTVIDGGKFDSRRLTEIDTELAALDDVASEVLRRAYQKAKDEAGERRVTAMANVQRLEAERYAVLQEAEAHTRSLADIIVRFKKLTADQLAVLGSIGVNAPLAHWPAQIDRRLSYLLVSTLFLPFSNKTDFGIIEWGSVPMDARSAWQDYEKSACALPIEKIVNPEGQSDDRSAH